VRSPLMRYYRLAKPYLLVVLLYLGVVWLWERNPKDLPYMLVGLPVLVGIYVHSKVLEEIRVRQRGIELTISVVYPAPKYLREHPYFNPAHEAALRVHERLKQEGREHEYGRLMSEGIGTQFRFLYHGGLVWSEPRKSFVSRAFVAGRIFGNVLGDVKSEAADIEPSLMIVESHGVVGVLLVPVQPDEAFVSTRREKSEMRAFNVFDEQKVNELLNRKPKVREPGSYDYEFKGPGEPPAVLLGQFPVHAFRRLLALGENNSAVSQGEFDSAWDALMKRYGLSAPKRTRDPEFDPLDVFELDSEWIRFTFGQTGGPA